MDALIQFCMALTRHFELTYVLRSKEVDPEEVFSDVGLLPALLKRSDQLASLCFGVTSGASYKDEDKSMLGTRLILPKKPLPVSSLVCIQDTLLEISRGVKKNRVELDELLYD